MPDVFSFVVRSACVLLVIGIAHTAFAAEHETVASALSQSCAEAAITQAATPGGREP